MFRLLYFIPIWLAYLFLIKVPVNALGLLVTVYTYRLRNTPYDKTPVYLRWWINKEDWHGGVSSLKYNEKCPGTEVESLPRWWIKREGLGFRSHWIYHAWRNGGDGLRVGMFGVKVDPDRVEYKTKIFMKEYSPQAMRKLGITKASYLCWQGVQAGCKIVWNHGEIKGVPVHTVIKLGWRLVPRHAALSDADVEKDPLLHMRSFATKFLYKHEDQN